MTNNATNIKSVEYKSIWIENDITLPDMATKTDVPFVFNGKNLTNSTILVRAVPTCGCTTSERGEFTVGPMEPFEIKGLYRAVDKPQKYSKRVSVYFGTTNTSDQDQKVSVTFRGNIV